MFMYIVLFITCILDIIVLSLLLFIILCSGDYNPQAHAFCSLLFLFKVFFVLLFV